MSMMGNMLIAQSGGPTVAVNASLSGALRRAMGYREIKEIYGARNGIEGVLRENFVPLRPYLSREEDFIRLTETPAMVLGSCRKRLSETPDGEYEKIREIFRRWGIQYFFYIGGNDSMDTVRKLSAYFAETGDSVRVVGIPKTIDNDIACTDHTPGFGSAARYIATSIAEVAQDSEIYDLKSITLVEIMGRNAGWLTAASVLARRPGCSAPHLICMPEVPFDDDLFLRRVEQLHRERDHVLVAVSEGIRYADGSYVAAADKLDAFGHRQLSGAAHRLAMMVRERFGCKVRPIELNVLQRAASHLRSETDIDEAIHVGAEAVTLGVMGHTGIMATFERVSDQPYRIRYEYADIREVANVEKTVPLEWIDAQRMDVSDRLRTYLLPLISNPGQKESGIPVYFELPPGNE